MNAPDLKIVGGIPLTDRGCVSNGYHNTSCLCLNRFGPADAVSDGHHTFGELYDHRRALTALLATLAATDGDSWRSKEHHPDDDPMFEGGYFIVGIDLPGIGTITYHYKLKHWDDFLSVPELAHAPKWDGAPPSATVERLLEAVRQIAQDPGQV
jgi:hypothetical protein